MNYSEQYYAKVVRLADYVTKTHDPKMKWMWGEALLGYHPNVIQTKIITE